VGDRKLSIQMKVRTQRRRPESRGDQGVDLETRFTSGSQNEEPFESNVNPWTGPLETTMTTDSVHTPFGLEDHEIRISSADQRSDTELLQSLAPAINLKSTESSLEQEHLTRQLKTMALEVKRIRSQAAASRALERDVIEPASWSHRESKLVQNAVGRWNRLKMFKMAEQVLMGAVELREANIIAYVPC
jgi:kinesin family protein 1